MDGWQESNKAFEKEMEKVKVYILDALKDKLKGELAVAKANVRVYLNNPVGIGEHPEVVQAIESQIEVIATAQEKLDIINKHF